MELILCADETVLRQTRKGFECGILSENDDGKEWARWILEDGFDSGEVGGVLVDGVVELIFDAAEVEHLCPELALSISVDPAGIIF